MSRFPIIITITGTSGVGKGYLKDYLKQEFGLDEPAVYTTRKRRVGENRPDRRFVSESEFKEILKQKGIVFPQKLYGDRYGFDKNSFSKGNIITEVHMDIAQRFRALFPNALMIALTTDNPKFLEYRLTKRGDDPKLACKRIKASEKEIASTRALKKIFYINYEVGFENENRIVEDIKLRLNSLIDKKNSAVKRVDVLKKLKSKAIVKKRNLNRFKKIRRN